MKFLITGSVRSDKGPKKIIVFTYIFFLFFILSNLYLSIMNTSFNFQEFLSLLEPSFTIRLETVHIQLFLFLMFFLFNFAMLYQTKFSIKTKNMILFITVIYFLFYILSLILYVESLWFFYFYHFSILGFHIYILFIQILLIKDLWNEENKK